MLKIFLIYALLAGASMFPWFYVFYGNETSNHLKRVAKETDTTTGICTVVFSILLFITGWLWIPFKAIKTIVRKIKGE